MSVEPVVVGSRARSPESYMSAAGAVLARGGSALDAAEAGVRVVEEDVSDHGVGIGGMPNRDGLVELDAAIMDGTTGAFGGVAALRGFGEAITVAQAVRELAPRHVLVSGEGAAGIARRIGLRQRDLLTAEAREAWEQWRAGAHLNDPPVTGTINVLARDGHGRLAAAVSTSGWEWKEPGRIGDSCVPGAGLYADDRVGAAACTGIGEASLLRGTARLAVQLLDQGRTPEEAAVAALGDLRGLAYRHAIDDFAMTVVVLSADGRHAGASTEQDKQYASWMSGVVSKNERVHVPLDEPAT
jgi:beta-aspartyl-peptidase (threonine type)